MIYLDCAATTKPKAEVIKVITESLESDWYNPSSLYKPSISTYNKIKTAREVIAKSINAKPSEIYFTSGGSEGNNMILKGYQKANPNCPIITSCIEHKSIHDIENVLFVDVDSDGYINTDTLQSKLQNAHNPLVSIQYASNELGVLQNIPLIARMVHEHGGVFHTDAVQAYPHHNINVKKLGVDFMTVSGHKFGCPKGIGFVYISNRHQNTISPLICGSQERGLRGGTENTPYILGLSKAVALRQVAHNEIGQEIEEKRHYFENQLKSIGCRINCEYSHRLENVISCMLPENVVGETVMHLLAFNEIYVSTGSACNSRSNKPSHVLTSIGLSTDEVRRTIRISFDFDITKDDIDKTIIEMKRIINNIR